MKKLLEYTLVVIFVFFISNAFSQECVIYFPMEEGMEVEMTNYDKKNKISGTYTQKIEKKEITGDNLNLTILQKVYDDKGEFVHEGTFGMHCEEGVFYLDMSSYLDEKMMEAYEGMELQVETTDMMIPSKLVIGESLPDANVIASVSNQGIKMMTITIDITDRKVVAEEDLTTPAGTFKCFKMTYQISTKMGIRVQGDVSQWLNKDVGVVKTESYSNKGKLQGITLLTGLKK